MYDYVCILQRFIFNTIFVANENAFQCSRIVPGSGHLLLPADLQVDRSVETGAHAKDIAGIVAGRGGEPEPSRRRYRGLNRRISTIVNDYANEFQRQRTFDQFLRGIAHNIQF